MRKEEKKMTDFKHRWGVKPEKFWMRFGKALPKKLKKWAFIDVVCYATTGEYSNTVVPELTAMEALKRFD